MKDDFEKQLEKEPFRTIPPEWREGILGAAQTRAELRHISRFSAWLAARKAAFRWRELFWPCPQAWGALAAAWVLMLIINLNNTDPEPIATVSAPATRPSPQTLMALQQQRRWQAELIKRMDDDSPEPQAAPKPRTENEIEHVAT